MLSRFCSRVIASALALSSGTSFPHASFPPRSRLIKIIALARAACEKRKRKLTFLREINHHLRSSRAFFVGNLTRKIPKLARIDSTPQCMPGWERIIDAHACRCVLCNDLQSGLHNWQTRNVGITFLFHLRFLRVSLCYCNSHSINITAINEYYYYYYFQSI